MLPAPPPEGGAGLRKCCFLLSHLLFFFFLWGCGVLKLVVKGFAIDQDSSARLEGLALHYALLPRPGMRRSRGVITESSVVCLFCFFREEEGKREREREGR